MIVEYKQQPFHITRYPNTNNRSLRAWNAADEYLLDTVAGINVKPESLIIYNDRFGFLSCLLSQHQPFTVMTYRSQEKACTINLEANKLTVDESHWLSPLATMPTTVEYGLIRIPKSLELFRFYLYLLSQAIPEDGIVYCAFMTRHFSPRMLDAAGEFFEEVEQTKAWKKARLLILKKKKPFQKIDFVHTIKMDDTRLLKQYPGVFSANNIDYASQFLMEQMQDVSGAHRILDLASGNGLLAAFLRDKHPDAEIHLLEDFLLALESSRLNLVDPKSFFHYEDSLENLESDSFDLVISNPPFHFEYETNIEVALSLFEEVARCLKKEGSFQLVASLHLNYKTHLEKLFSSTIIIAENDKYVVYACRK